MARFHVTAKVVSRSKGQSVVAKAAYNARDKLLNERDGQPKDYRELGDTVFSGIFAPEDAPEWARDREALWNEVERGEKRKDAQLAVELEMALPHELTDEQRRHIVVDFAREEFLRKGLVADVNIHPPPREPEDGKEPNHHVHVLVALREIGPDDFGKRVINSGSLGENAQQIDEWRERWAERGARELRKAGFDLEADRYAVGHLTLPEQRHEALERGDLEWAEELNREPTRHRGPAVDAMERRSVETDRGREAREAEQSKPKELRIERIEGQLMAVTCDENNQPSVHSLDDVRFAVVDRRDVADLEILREAQKAKGMEQAPELYEGELVAVMLDEQNQPRIINDFSHEQADETHKYLRNIDLPNAPSVRKASLQLYEWVAEREAQTDQWHDLSKKAGEIRLAHALSQTPEEFIQGMAERGVHIARVSKRDIIQNAYEHEFLAEGAATQDRTLSQEIDQLDPRRLASLSLHEGDLVAVDRFGSVSFLNEHTTGDTRKEIGEFLGPLAQDLPGICQLREQRPEAAKGLIRDDDAREQHQQWEERIASAEQRGAGSRAARERQAEAERPEGWIAQFESSIALEQMRELNTELVVMRRELREQLRDDNLGIEHRAALNEIARELRDLHVDTRMEINALRGEQPSYEIAAREISRDTFGEALADSVQGVARGAGDLAGGLADVAGKAVEFVTDFFMTPSLPTPELIAARREAREEQVAAAEFNWKRYKEDEVYRAQTDRQDQLKREQEEREYMRKQERELFPNERERDG
jgi:hypothetical protein